MVDYSKWDNLNLDTSSDSEDEKESSSLSSQERWEERVAAANKLYEKGDLDAAIDLYRKNVDEIERDNKTKQDKGIYFRSLMNLAVMFYQNDDANAGLVYSSKAIRIRSNDAKANHIHSQLLQKANKPSYIQFLRKAAQLDPKDEDIQKSLKQAASSDSNSLKLTIETLHTEAFRAQKNRDFQKAITIWTKVLEIVSGRSKMMEAGVLRYLAFCHARTTVESDLVTSFDFYTKSLEAMSSMGDVSAAAKNRCRVVQIERLQIMLQISSSLSKNRNKWILKTFKEYSICKPFSKQDIFELRLGSLVLSTLWVLELNDFLSLSLLHTLTDITKTGTATQDKTFRPDMIASIEKMIRKNFVGDDEISLRISNEASETLSNAYACVASGKSENMDILFVDRKELRLQASEIRSEFARRCLTCFKPDVYDRKRDTCEVLALQASYESMVLLSKDSKYDEMRLDLLQKHLKIAKKSTVRDESMRSEACAFRAKALIFAAVPLRDRDEKEMLLLERLKAADVLSHVEDVCKVTHFYRSFLSHKKIYSNPIIHFTSSTHASLISYHMKITSHELALRAQR